MSKLLICDIFCAVVDNYGDIGVCWRLAKQLSNEHGMAVRLWVDDLASFRRLCTEINPELSMQQCRGVEVRHWSAETFHSLPASRPSSRSPSPQAPDGTTSRPTRQPKNSCQVVGYLPPAGEGGRQAGRRWSSEIIPAQLVIEAFACELPQSYVAAMATQTHKPVWINLEYLSAEDWVPGCHGLPSPHPSLPLVKYFFFPGFTPQTGGLLLEHDLLARRDAFQRDPQAIAAFWQALGVSPPKPDETRVSLFCYENPALPGLFAAWAAGSASVCCLVPEGRALPQVAGFFGQASFDGLRMNGVTPGDVFKRGNLRVQVLPFVEQERYDELLWACDINFVRGEDSCVRAQWAGKPFIWHIYPQHDGVHMQKLRAFMNLYCTGLPTEAAQALHGLWEGWNGERGQGIILNSVRTEPVEGQMGFDKLSPNELYISSDSIIKAWNEFWMRKSMLQQHAYAWAQQLSGNSLALNLLDFFQKIDRMHGL